MTALPPAVGRKVSVAAFWPAGGTGLTWAQVPSRAQMAFRLSDLGCFFADSSATARETHIATATRRVILLIMMSSFAIQHNAKRHLFPSNVLWRLGYSC